MGLDTEGLHPILKQFTVYIYKIPDFYCGALVWITPTYTRMYCGNPYFLYNFTSNVSKQVETGIKGYTINPNGNI